MDTLTKKFYEKIKEEPQEYEKIKLIVDMHNNLIITRINSLIEKFNGNNYYNQCFFRDFYSEKRGLNYAIDIYANDYQYSYLQLFSREVEESPDKYKQDNKDIENWLKEHKLFEGFYKKGNEIWWRWTKDFKFPEDEKALYDFTKELIECLEKYVESIYSEK